MEMPKFTCQQLDAIVESLMGMPCFVILAKDAAAVPSVRDYVKRSVEVGGRNTIRSSKRADEIEQWQKQNHERVKIPD